jgi:tRNA 2-selenouridine synthase
MRQAPLIKVIVPKSEREKRLVHEYGDFKQEALLEQLIKIRERLGGQYLKEAVKALENNNLQLVAGITLRYYDKAYAHGASQRSSENIYQLEVEKDDPVKNAGEILNYLKKIEFP